MPSPIPPPDPNSPEGLSFIFSAGMIDPRSAMQGQRMPMMLVQGWPLQSRLYWELGIRYHPELATKHLKGGGQFSVADIIDGPPPPPDAPMTPEEAAEKMLDIVAESNPEFAAAIRRMKNQGETPEKARLREQLNQNMSAVLNTEVLSDQSGE